MEQKIILSVEDDVDLMFLIKKKLEESGFKVLTAETGQMALDILKEKKPDLILMDILLPDIDGLTVLSQISSQAPTKDIPVIILSNLADHGAFEQAGAIGNYEYLVKATTDLDTVVKKVEEKLNVV